MEIGSIGGLGHSSNLQLRPVSTGTREASKSFLDALASHLENLNDEQLKTQNMARDFIAGGNTSIEDLVVQMEQAKLHLDLTVAIRNKTIEAYQEIMRLQF